MESPRQAIDPAHVAQVDHEEVKQAQAAASESAADVKVDGALIKQIWYYVRPSDRLPGEGAIKNEGNDLAQELRQDIRSALAAID